MAVPGKGCSIFEVIVEGGGTVPSERFPLEGSPWRDSDHHEALIYLLDSVVVWNRGRFKIFIAVTTAPCPTGRVAVLNSPFALSTNTGLTLTSMAGSWLAGLITLLGTE